jgi:hypothetical protein
MIFYFNFFHDTGDLISGCPSGIKRQNDVGSLLVSILVFQNALQDLQLINVPPNTLKKQVFGGFYDVEFL